MLLVDAEDQGFFLGQYTSFWFVFPIVGFPDPIAQTWSFFVRFQQVFPDVGVGHRATLCETTLQEHSAGELIERFTSRSGEPMDPTGWSAYAPAKILYESVVAAGTTEGSELALYLKSPEASFDLSKGADLSVRPWDYQLSQPLYLFEIDPEAGWGARLSQGIEIAELVGELPAGGASGFDRLGDGPDELLCQFWGQR